MPNAKEIYRRSVSLLPSEEKLQLAALIVNDLAAPDGQSRERVSVVEMISSLPAGHGFSTPAEADEYLCAERESWDH